MKNINENRLFELLPNFFSKASSLLVELAQNAQRAGATKMDITLSEDGVLKVSDNGQGTKDPGPLFVLADSDWEEDIERNQTPAGWGLFFLYCVSERVKLTSLFGTIEVDTRRFLKDDSYRANILADVDTDSQSSGFHLEAVIDAKIKDKVVKPENLKWFPLDITVNGEPIKREDPENKSWDIKTSYKGNTVYIDLDYSLKDLSNERVLRELMVIWYGIPIRNDIWHPEIMMVVTDGTPLTPVLPYRESVKDDEKLEEFRKFLRDTIVAHCIEKINNPDNNEFNLSKYMEFMESLGTQDELDSLNRFYVTKKEPHHHSSNMMVGRAFHLVNKDTDPLVSEELEISGLDDYLGIKRGDDEELPGDIVLQEGVIISYELPKNYPSWLKVETKKVVVIIEPFKDTEYSGDRLIWTRADIKCAGKDLRVLSYTEDYDTPVNVFYSDDPGDISEIDNIIFDSYVFYDEGDTWDSQKDEFDKEIRNDIMQITGVYEAYELLSGLYSANISPSDVLSLRLDMKAKTMEIVTEKETKILNVR